MLLGGWRQESLKSRIHFIKFSVLGEVPGRVPQRYNLILWPQKSSIWWPLSTMYSSFFPHTSVKGGNCWGVVLVLKPRVLKAERVRQCLTGKKKKDMASWICLSLHPMYSLNRCYAKENSPRLELCTLMHKSSVTQLIILRASCQWQPCISLQLLLLLSIFILTPRWPNKSNMWKWVSQCHCQMLCIASGSNVPADLLCWLSMNRQ